MHESALIAVLAAAAGGDAVEQAQNASIGAHAIVVAVTSIVVSVCALLHYELLNALSHWLSQRERGPHRRRVLFAIFGVLSVHVVEIWIFGLVSAALLLVPQFGLMIGSIGGGVFDQVYLSAATFTTMGTADTHIVGPLRFFNGTEALTGLVLIGWSASFTYLEMGRYWRDH